MTASMAKAADEIEIMINDFAGDGETANNMKLLLLIYQQLVKV